MKNYHHPLTKHSKLRVSFEFLLHWRTIVNLRSYTSRCDDCGKLIDGPVLDDYNVWFPALYGFVLGFSFIISHSRHISWYHPLITIVMNILSEWIIPSQILAFGKWTEPAIGSMSEGEYRVKKIEMFEKKRKSKPYIIKACLSSVLCFLLLFGGLYLA